MVQTRRSRTLCLTAKVEADLLQINSKIAIDSVGATALDVDDHFSGTVLQNTAHCGGESGLVRPA